MMVKILGDGIQMIILRNAQRWSLEKSSLFSKLNKIIIEKILDSIKIYNYKAGDILIPKSGLGSSKIIIVLEGAVRFKKMVVEKGGIFGDEFFFEENQKKM